MNRLRRRLASSEGFTLIELLVVIVIIGILLAIAIPSYLGFRKQAQDTAGESNVREAIPSAESYYASNSTYVGMGTTQLKAIDSGLSPSVAVDTTPTATDYCLSAPGQGSVVGTTPALAARSPASSLAPRHLLVTRGSKSEVCSGGPRARRFAFRDTLKTAVDACR